MGRGLLSLLWKNDSANQVDVQNKPVVIQVPSPIAERQWVECQGFIVLNHVRTKSEELFPHSWKETFSVLVENLVLRGEACTPVLWHYKDFDKCHVVLKHQHTQAHLLAPVSSVTSEADALSLQTLALFHTWVCLVHVCVLRISHYIMLIIHFSPTQSCLNTPYMVYINIKPGPHVYIFGCRNDSYFPNVASCSPLGQY